MSSMDKKINEQLSILSANLYELRTKTLKNDGKPWTQSDIASKLGITYQSYQAYELGKAVPTIQNFLKIAEIYDVSLDYLVGKKEY